ncbi:MAG: Ig-like domain-containing protein [Anaerolineae bacterium]|nr:Ig-like domain-containing protein [Anaerolineae bacterium]
MSTHNIRWLGVGITAVIMALTLAGIAGGVVWGQDDALPPQVFDTMPFAGEELALDGPVTFYFEQAMDAASVEAAFSVTPEIAGDLAWSGDDTLVFTPSGEYDRAVEYTFTIAESAESAAGAALEAPFELKLRTIGYLEVSEALPNPDAEFVDSDSVITVIFNRPVVPLVSVEDMGDLPHPLSFAPDIPGAGEWLNTSIYLFTPSEELRGGTTYTITVNAGLEDVTGGLLAEDYVWSFSTLKPDVLEIYPNNDHVVLEDVVRVEFSQAMDPEAVANGGFVLQQTHERDMQFPDDPRPLETPRPVTGSFEWGENFRELTFTPDEDFELEGRYEIYIDADKALSATGSTLREDANAVFNTVPYPRIVSTSPSDGAYEASPYGGFSIRFNTPMDLDSLKDKIFIDPEPWREFDTYFYDWSYQYNLAFDTEPTTDYTITILPGMMDRYGNTIDEGMTVTYTTAAYPPELTIQATGDIGMYSSENATTRVFVTHRNISRIDLSLYDVALRDLARFTGPDSWDEWQQYNPNMNTLLRQWTIDVSSQQDVRRYELLYISDKGASGITNIQCLGAPATQVKMGDVVIVTDDDPSPLNIRQEPNLTAQTLTQVLPGETMQIVGGPFCEGGYLWWQMRLDNGSVGWAAEGTLANYFYAPLTTPPQDANAPATETGTGENLPEALDPGIYWLRVDSPETQEWDSRPRDHVMLVQSANITLKFSQDTALAWVTDLQSGDPIPDLPVIFYNSNFNPVARGTTDADGLAVAQIPHLADLYSDMYAVVDEADQFGFAVSRWSDGMDPWQFDIYSDYNPEDRTAYIYTDRPIYRPGQPVYFKGTLRDRDDMTYSVPGMQTVPVKAYDDRGELIYDKVLDVTPHGSFSGQIDLDTEAPLGYYRITVEVGSNQRDSFGASFSVAEYRAPEFQVDVLAATDQVAQGDTIQVAVESRYFFGGAVSNADVRYSVVASDYNFNYTGDEPGWWSFTDENWDFYAPDYYGSYGQSILDGEGTTDAQGNFLIEIPADLGEKSQSQTYQIEVSVTDESDQLVAGRTSVIVHQGQVYVGLQPEEYVGRAERENNVNLLAVDWSSDPVAGQEIAYEIVERRWFSVQEEDDFGRTLWTWDVEENPVEGGSGTVTTDADGKATISFTPPFGGTYKVYATTTDADGNEIRSSAFMWVSGSEFINWRQENSNRIQLITDADEYAVGDTAEILIPSPWQGAAWALLTVERGDILTTDVIKLETNSTVYELPITGDYAPNIFVSVVLVKGVDENNPVAQFRMGVADLAVDTSQLVMDLEITPNIDVDAGEFAGPGDTVEYTIKVTDYKGDPVPNAEIGVGVTDLSVLSIAPSNTPDLLPFFYSERGITVKTAMPLTISVDQATQVIIDTIKGGGGGFGEGGIFEVRQEFVDTPLWEPFAVTDENGEAVVSVTLPDNLTTWRLDARAITMGATAESDDPMLVGQGQFDLLSTKPVLIRPGTPRFFIVNDKVTLAAIVNNNTSEDLSAEVLMQGTGFKFAEGYDIAQNVIIPAKGRARVNWEVEILDVQAVDLNFAVNAEDGRYTDATKPTVSQGAPLPVYKYEVPETVGTAGTIYGPEAGSRTESIVLPRRFDVSQGNLTVRVDRSLAAATVDGMDWLENYPHYCIEQIISRFLPNAVTLNAMRELGVEDPELAANLEVQVGYALQRLYAQQKADGGWGWFAPDDSNPIVTAYALIGLAETQNAGFDIDERVISKAASFVESELRTVRAQDSKWVINRQAFLLYALARSDRGNFQRTVRLFNEKENMSLYAQAYLAMTFHILAPDDTRAMELVTDLNNALIVSATGAHWEEDYYDYWNWNTDTRTTALGLLAMAQIDPDNQLIPNVVRWLMVARDADHWETTQETAWAVMGLAEWMVVTGELYPDYTFNVSLNNQRLALEDNTATPDNVKETETLVIQVAELLADEANRLTISRTEGDGNLYYTAHLTAWLPVPEVEALNRGMIISRKYSLLNDPDHAAIESAEVGEAVQVSITIIAPNNLHYVVIEDPIPAGADAVNPNLTTSQQVGTRPNLSRDNPYRQGWGWWWFSNIEMRDEKVVMYATYLPRGTYQFNYVIYPGLAGEYNVIPTTGQEFYFPEVYGRSDGMLFTVTGGTASDAMVPAEEPVEDDTEADAAESDAGAVGLTESFTGAGMTISYPAGWIARENEGGIELANSEDTFAAVDDPESEGPTEGQAALFIQPILAEEVGGMPLADLVPAYVQGMASEAEGAEVGELTEIQVGAYTAWLMSISVADSMLDGAVVGFALSDDLYAVAVLVAHTGELADSQALMLDMIGSVTVAE